MTYLSPADRARSAAPTGSLMKTPDYLRALITKDIKPFNWQKSVQQMERVAKQAELDKNIARELAFEKVRLEHERRRRQKLAQIEALMNRHRDKSASVVEPEPEIEDIPEMTHLKNPRRTHLLVSLFCRIVGVSEAWICSKERTRKIARPRQILMWILYRNTGKSLPAIGRTLGGRDHSTILHGVRKVNSTPAFLDHAKTIEKELLFLELEVSRNG